MKNFVILFCVLFIPVVLNSHSSIITNENVNEFNYPIVKFENQNFLKIPELFKTVSDMEIKKNGGILDTNEVREIIDSIIFDTLVGLEASKIDINEHIVEKQIYRDLYNNFLTSVFYEDEVYGKVEVDSQKVIDFFFDRQDIFGVLVTIYFTDILFSPDILIQIDSSLFSNLYNKKSDEEVEEFVLETKKKINSREEFYDFLSSFSKDTVLSSTSILIGYGSRYRDGGIRIIDSMAFGMTIDSISEPFRDENGWHLIYINDKIIGENQPLPQWVYQLAIGKYKENEASKRASILLDPYLDSLNLQINNKFMDKDLSKVPPYDWIAVINNIDTVYVKEAQPYDKAAKNKFKKDITTIKMKQNYLERIARKYIIIQRAKAGGYDNKPEVVKKSNEYKHTIAKRIVTKIPYDQIFKPSDSMIEEYYKNNLDKFIEDKPLKVQHIITADSSEGLKIRELAIEGADFLSLADEYYPGNPSIRRKLSDLGYIGINDVSLEFFNVAKNLEEGEISYPVKTKYGYHIIKLLDIKKVQDIDKVRNKISSFLRKQSNEKYKNKIENSLKTKYNVKYVGDLYPIQLKPLVDRVN